MQRRTFITATLGCAAAMANGPASAGARLHSCAALAFGTTVRISVYYANPALAALAIGEGLEEIRAVDRLMSIYDERSQVARLNRNGELTAPDPRLLAVLHQARLLSRLTRGAFDVTVQPLWRACHDARERGGMPATAERLQARAKVGSSRLQFSQARVRFAEPGMALTLNGLAQGYAADLALAALRARGIENALVDAGEFAVVGNKGSGPWRIGVADPRDAQVLATTLTLDGRCAATSGDYASSFTADFVHHHIFDPATGISPQELASVTVLAPTGMLADGLSTAFMVMGERKSHALASRMQGVDLLTINKRGILWRSPGLPSAA